MSSSSTLGLPTSPTRARSVSQPLREGVATDFSNIMPSIESSQMKPVRSAYMRSHSSGTVQRTSPSTSHATLHQAQPSKGRARSSSLMTVTEVGGDEPENVVDRMGVGTNENANWVNAPGKHSSCPTVCVLIDRLMDHTSNVDPPRQGVSRCYTWHDAGS